MRPNRIRRKLAENQAVFGVNLQIDSPWLVEIIGYAGFDYVMLDCEHGFAAYNLPTLILAAEAIGLTPIVRLPGHERSIVLPPLEAGAGGVQVAMVNTADEARALVHEVKFAPLGGRGFSNVTRAAHYGGLVTDDYLEGANRETLLIVQLETRQALENVGEIAAVPGVDVIFFGPGDLSQSLGVAGALNSDLVRGAIREAIQRIGGARPVATTAFSADEVHYWWAQGVSVFLSSTMTPIRRAFEHLHADLLAGL